MIGTVQKPLEEILDALEPYDRVVVVGCDGCAKACKSGGTDEVAVMAQKLGDAGKNVILEVTPERTCLHRQNQNRSRPSRGYHRRGRRPAGYGLRGSRPDHPPGLRRLRPHRSGQGGPQFHGPPRHPQNGRTGSGTMPGMRRLRAQRNRRHLPGDQMRQKPAQRPLRRRGKRQNAKSIPNGTAPGS